MVAWPFLTPKRLPTVGTMTLTTSASGSHTIVTPPEVHLQCEVLRLTALLTELRLILEGWRSGDVCLKEWDDHPCPCCACRGLRAITYGL